MITEQIKNQLDVIFGKSKKRSLQIPSIDNYIDAETNNVIVDFEYSPIKGISRGAMYNVSIKYGNSKKRRGIPFMIKNEDCRVGYPIFSNKSPNIKEPEKMKPTLSLKMPKDDPFWEYLWLLQKEIIIRFVIYNWENDNISVALGKIFKKLNYKDKNDVKKAYDFLNKMYNDVGEDEDKANHDKFCRYINRVEISTLCKEQYCDKTFNEKFKKKSGDDTYMMTKLRIPIIYDKDEKGKNIRPTTADDNNLKIRLKPDIFGIRIRNHELANKHHRMVKKYNHFVANKIKKKGNVTLEQINKKIKKYGRELSNFHKNTISGIRARKLSQTVPPSTEIPYCYCEISSVYLGDKYLSLSASCKDFSFVVDSALTLGEVDEDDVYGTGGDDDDDEDIVLSSDEDDEDDNKKVKKLADSDDTQYDDIDDMIGDINDE